MEIDDETKG
jgi:hypothetical protein